MTFGEEFFFSKTITGSWTGPPRGRRRRFFASVPGLGVVSKMSAGVGLAPSSWSRHVRSGKNPRAGSPPEECPAWGFLMSGPGIFNVRSPVREFLMSGPGIILEPLQADSPSSNMISFVRRSRGRGRCLRKSGGRLHLDHGTFAAGKSHRVGRGGLQKKSRTGI